ncbi:MAG: phosphatase PAP2 family protein [Alphaproteobacteria bacterium]
MTVTYKVPGIMLRVKGLSWAWVVIALLMTIDAAWLERTGLSISRNSVLVSAAAIGGMLALTVIYSYLRPDERLAALTENVAKLFAYSISLAVFGYLVVTLRAPLIDNWLAASDRAVGFDWPAVYAWVGEHKVIRLILIMAYDSLVPQLGILMTLLITLKRYDRAQSLLWLYIVSSLAYVLISAFLPAAGAFGTYQTALDTPYLQQFYTLRSGDMKTLDLLQLQGVVQFPSFHLALAVLCAYATWGMRFLFPVFMILNLLVIAATPAIGGHFFADLWVSALLIVVLIFLVERGLKASRQPIL